MWKPPIPSGMSMAPNRKSRFGDPSGFCPANCGDANHAAVYAPIA
jgi:hypothetical protein